MVDRDSVVCETKDAIEPIANILYRLINYRRKRILLSESKREAWFFGGLSKVLAFNGQVANLKNIVRDKTLHRTRSILNREFRTIRLITRGRAGVVFGV